MAKALLLSTTNLVLITTILHFLLIAISLRCVKATRVLTEVDIPPPVSPPEPEPSNIATTPVTDMAPGIGPAANSSATSAQNPLTFFMHDILGGSAPSERVVAGIALANKQAPGGGLPFAKRNRGVFNGGIPLTVLKGAILGATLKSMTAGQFTQGAAIQQLKFGAITVIDDEVTEGHDIGSFVIGKAQGFYLTSSLDGSSHVLAFTALFGGDDHDHDHGDEDCISFFGVHRTATATSPIAVVGGTGKYGNAEGYAMVETFHLMDQHTTDGVETLLQFTVHLVT